MKHWIRKFISCILTIAIFMSAIELSPQMIVYADNSVDYTVLDDASQEAMDECYTIVPEKPVIGIRLVLWRRIHGIFSTIGFKVI